MIMLIMMMMTIIINETKAKKPLQKIWNSRQRFVPHGRLTGLDNISRGEERVTEDTIRVLWNEGQLGSEISIKRGEVEFSSEFQVQNANGLFGPCGFRPFDFYYKLKTKNQTFTIVIFNVWSHKNWKSQIYNLNCQFLFLIIENTFLTSVPGKNLKIED